MKTKNKLVSRQGKLNLIILTVAIVSKMNFC